MLKKKKNAVPMSDKLSGFPAVACIPVAGVTSVACIPVAGVISVACIPVAGLTVVACIPVAGVTAVGGFLATTTTTDNTATFSYDNVR